MVYSMRFWYMRWACWDLVSCHYQAVSHLHPVTPLTCSFCCPFSAVRTLRVYSLSKCHVHDTGLWTSVNTLDTGCPSFAKAEWYLIMCTLWHHCQWWPSGGFHALAVVDNSTVNVEVQVALGDPPFIFPEDGSRSGTPGHMTDVRALCPMVGPVCVPVCLGVLFVCVLTSPCEPFDFLTIASPVGVRWW